MKKALLNSSTLGLLGGVLLLAGCGGGGGGGDTFTPPNIPNSPVAIDSNNQYEVADAAENGVGGAMDGGGGVLGVVVEGGGSSFSAFDYAETTLLKYTGQAAAVSQSSPAGVSVSQTIPCDSGSMRISASISDPNGEVLSTGDTFTMTFNSCADNFDGTTTNGTISFSVVSGSLDTNATSLSSPVTIAASFNNLRTTENGETDVVHGGFDLSTDGTTETLSGDSLYVMKTGGEAAQLTDFTISSTTSGITDSITVDMTIASTDINGEIRVQTDPSNPLLQDTFEEHPHAGTLIITGGTTTLTMVILSTTSVELTLDADGVAGADAGYPVTVTWTEIDNGAADPLI